jgi:hypothetical protein
VSVRCPLHERRSLRSIAAARQGTRGELGNIEQLGRRSAGGGDRDQRVAKHGVAEGAGGGDRPGAGLRQFARADVGDTGGRFSRAAGAFLFSKESKPAAGAAAKRPLVVAWSFDERRLLGDYGAGFFVDVLVAAQIAGVVVDDVVRGAFFVVRCGQAGFVASHKLAVVFDLNV